MLNIQGVIRDLSRFKIMIIGDDATVRRTVRTMLQTIGFDSFREAEDGDDALRKMRAESFDFIVCDFRMPIMNGPQVLEAMRRDESLAGLPFLLLSPQLDKEAAASITAGPLEDYVTEPFLPQTLEDCMAGLIFRNWTPTELDQHLQEAGAAMAAKDYEKAHRALDAAEAAAPRSPLASYFRRLAYEGEGRTDLASEAVEQARAVFAAVVQGPRLAEEALESGRRLLKEGRMEEARDMFDQAVEFDPDNPAHRISVGEAYLSQGMAAEAAEVFKASLEEDPKNVYLYNRLGIAYRRQKKFEESVASYQRALEIDPHEENLHYNLARAHLAAGDRRGAVEALELALSLVPGFKEAADLLAKLEGRL